MKATQLRTTTTWRTLAVLALGLASLSALWSAGGCAKERKIVPARPMPNTVMDLPTVIGDIRDNARPWKTLEADCSVIISSPQIAVRGGQVGFAHGRLQIEKPGKIRLEAVQGQRRITLVGDGKTYRVDMPLFNDGYKGNYGDPLPVQPRRVLLMPDDLVLAWDWSGLFGGKVPVLKNLPGGAVLEMLNLVTEPQPDVEASSSIGFSRTQKRITSAVRYSANSAVRCEIIVMSVDTVPGPGKEPVRVPSRVRLTYPISWTAIEITLRNIQLNGEFPKGTFDIGS